MMVDTIHLRKTWAEIDIAKLIKNIEEVKRLTHPGALITAVVKANGYGHGATKVAKIFLDHGADRLAVAILDEAIELRKAGYSVPILILGFTPIEQLDEVVQYDLEQTIFSFESAQLLSNLAVVQKKQVKIHLKVDTGMGRIGFEPSENTIETIKRIAALPNIIIEGIFTHFAIADSTDKSYTNAQFKLFEQFFHQLNDQGIQIPIKHCANSAAIIDLPEYHLDMVRAGIMLYSVTPTKDMLRETYLEQVMTLKTKIAHIKTVEPGESISYGRTFTAHRKTRIATLPIGYADGYPRGLSNKGSVLVKGMKAPIVGRICMDQCMIDVTDIDDVHVDEEVVLFGQQGESFIAIDELAVTLGTINHEIICGINRRIPRLYIKDGEVVDALNYLL
ncbi:alanine racemase [Fusibacter paucivorans]|uniref:Alanine racemase n=1 Tax=Fusibacter paucivorans TaxID=76009 RepID=A0ABS5PSU1_9FIRM|nr:alanine racemase [Fusibacter paucivorans]MBS7527982.1 alanine racemase [Fusibacter paucivorans]